MKKYKDHVAVKKALKLMLEDPCITNGRIAKKVGLSDVTVGKIRFELGIPKLSAKQMYEYRMEKIKNLLEAGKSGAYLCKLFGISSATMAKYRKDLGIPAVNDQRITGTYSRPDPSKPTLSEEEKRLWRIILFSHLTKFKER